MKTAIEIVKKYLIENKCDGLFSDDCGCRVDDLVPCGGDFSQCVPGVVTGVVTGEDDETVYWEHGKTIECQFCGARFSPEASLLYGNYDNTSTIFNHTGPTIESYNKTGKCIICRRKIKNETE